MAGQLCINPGPWNWISQTWLPVSADGELVHQIFSSRFWHTPSLFLNSVAWFFQQQQHAAKTTIIFLDDAAHVMSS